MFAASTSIPAAVYAPAPGPDFFVKTTVLSATEMRTKQIANGVPIGAPAAAPAAALFSAQAPAIAGIAPTAAAAPGPQGQLPLRVNLV
jgi:hypothetical protein